MPLWVMGWGCRRQGVGLVGGGLVGGVEAVEHAGGEDRQRDEDDGADPGDGMQPASEGLAGGAVSAALSWPGRYWAAAPRRSAATSVVDTGRVAVGTLPVSLMLTRWLILRWCHRQCGSRPYPAARGDRICHA